MVTTVSPDVPRKMPSIATGQAAHCLCARASPGPLPKRIRFPLPKVCL